MMALMLLPDPKLTRAFDVLPLSAGDTAAAGHPVHWYQDWVAHERLTDDYWTATVAHRLRARRHVAGADGHRLVRHLPAVAAAALRASSSEPATSRG